MYVFNVITPILPAFTEKANNEKGKQPKVRYFAFYSGGKFT